MVKFSLLVLIVAIVTGAWADVTVYVQAETAPYLYAWDGHGSALNGGIWFGFSNVTFDGGQPSWVGQGPTDDNFEINLNNETLTSKIFTITATWGGGKYADKNWTVKIENAPAPEPENVEYFMVGSMNEWTKDNVNQLLPSKTEEGLYELVTTFAANDEFKIVSSTNVWYLPETWNMDCRRCTLRGKCAGSPRPIQKFLGRL